MIHVETKVTCDFKDCCNVATVDRLDHDLWMQGWRIVKGHMWIEHLCPEHKNQPLPELKIEKSG